MQEHPIRLYLLTGFLGAGKTTLLKRILDQLSTWKLGILMNEFGSVSIDGPLLRRHGVDIVEINNGSVFCSCLKGSFIDALVAYSELPIDYLFVETSGMADPSNIEPILTQVIGKVTGKPYDYRGALCLVDAANFLDQVEVLAALERQVAASSLIVINKADLVDATILNAVDAKVRDINSQAALVHARHGEIPLDFLSGALQPASRTQMAESCNTPFNRPTAHVVTAEGAYPYAIFQEFVHALVPWALRMKGFFLLEEGWHQVDAVGDQVEIQPTTIIRDVSELVVISTKGFAALTGIYGCWDQHFPGREMQVR